MSVFIDVRLFLSLLLRHAPTLAFEINELMRDWCESDVARGAAVHNCLIQIAEGTTKLAVARIRLDREYFEGQAIVFPIENLADYILSRSTLPQEMKERLFDSLFETWHRYPEVFHNYCVQIEGAEVAN